MRASERQSCSKRPLTRHRTNVGCTSTSMSEVSTYFPTCVEERAAAHSGARDGPGAGGRSGHGWVMANAAPLRQG